MVRVARVGRTGMAREGRVGRTGPGQGSKGR